MFVAVPYSEGLVVLEEVLGLDTYPVNDSSRYSTGRHARLDVWVDQYRGAEDMPRGVIGLSDVNDPLAYVDMRHHDRRETLRMKELARLVRRVGEVVALPALRFGTKDRVPMASYEARLDDGSALTLSLSAPEGPGCEVFLCCSDPDAGTRVEATMKGDPPEMSVSFRDWSSRRLEPVDAELGGQLVADVATLATRLVATATIETTGWQEFTARRGIRRFRDEIDRRRQYLRRRSQVPAAGLFNG